MSYFLDNVLVGVKITFLLDCLVVLFLFKHRRNIFELKNEESTGVEGGGAPTPLNFPKFLLIMTIMTVYFTEMSYLPLYTKDKKNFLLGKIYCNMVQQP